MAEASLVAFQLAEIIESALVVGGVLTITAGVGLWCMIRRNDEDR